jgi:hypothetical protein
MDSELNLLKQRLAVLEQTEKEKKEAEKKANSIEVLNVIINEKKKQIANNNYSRSLPLARFYDEEKVRYLEPIFYMLQDIQKRLAILENK